MVLSLGSPIRRERDQRTLLGVERTTDVLVEPARGEVARLKDSVLDPVSDADCLGLERKMKQVCKPGDRSKQAQVEDEIEGVIRGQFGTW